jgi:hypothetical protein
MKLSEIRATLKEIGVWPAKALGQNFLHDQNLARWIVDQAQINPEDYVVEIGPGLGALTRFILERGAQYFESVALKIPRTSTSYLIVSVDITEGSGNASFRITVHT